MIDRDNLRRMAGLVEQAAGSESVLEEHAMVGFKYGNQRVSPEVVGRVRACFKYEPEKKGKEGGAFTATVEVWISPEGKKTDFMAKLAKALPPVLSAAMQKEGMYPAGKMSPSCVGLAEIGTFHQQNSWSDDSYIAIRADTDEIAKIVGDVQKKVVPVGGGGVPGSSYKGSGMQKQADGEYVYHHYSFGIGD
jgi:hypothetical protein